LDGLKNPNQEKRKPSKPPEFNTWLLELPPINLWNVELVYLAFGYDTRYDLKTRVVSNGKEHTNVYDEERF